MTTKGEDRSQRPRGRAAGDFLFWLVGAALLAGMIHALTRETAAPQSPSQEELAARLAPVGRVTLSAPAAPAQTGAPAAAGQAATASKPADAGAGMAAEAQAGEGSPGAPPAAAEAPTEPPPVEAAEADLPETQPAEDAAAAEVADQSAASAAPSDGEPAPVPGSRPLPPEGMIWIRRDDLPGGPYELRPAPPAGQR